MVVKAERPDLEQLKTELTLQQNSFKINLKTLEEDLLSRLNSAGDDICRDVVLVNNLETAAVTSAEIKVKVNFFIIFLFSSVIYGTFRRLRLVLLL